MTSPIKLDANKIVTGKSNSMLNDWIYIVKFSQISTLTVRRNCDIVVETGICGNFSDYQT